MNTQALDYAGHKDRLTTNIETSSHVRQGCVPMTNADNLAISACRGTGHNSSLEQFGNLQLTDFNGVVRSSTEIKGQRQDIANGNHFGNDTQFSHKIDHTTTLSARGSRSDESDPRLAKSESTESVPQKSSKDQLKQGEFLEFSKIAV